MKLRSLLKTVVLLVFAIIPQHAAFSTAQFPDVLYYNEDTLYLFSNPLEQLYTKETRPRDFFNGEASCMSTACWRGYIGYWIIENDVLYLHSLESCCMEEDEIRADLALLFGSRYENGKVKADWFTGKMMAPLGEQIYYQHMGYESIYEKELILTFDKGNLVDTITYDNTKSKCSEYETDREKRNDFIFSNINWEKLPADDKEEVRIYISMWTDETGNIDSVRVGKSTNEAYNEEVLRVVKSIPEWTVYYTHGEFYNATWGIAVIIDKEVRKKYNR